MSERNGEMVKPTSYERVCLMMDKLDITRRILDMEDETGASFHQRLTTCRSGDELAVYAGYPLTMLAGVLDDVVEGRVAFNPEDCEDQAGIAVDTAAAVERAKVVQEIIEQNLAFQLT